jgi:ABC-2 type transport system ATP-binding protein
MTVLLQLQKVTHDYGRVRALQEVDLTIAAGAIGLVGQNGAGKSTMMQILLGLIRPTQGSATVLGLDVRTAGIALRGRVGYMPERDAGVPGLNGIEYVALAGELSGMPRRQALRRAHETLSYLGLEDARYRRLEQYSVGMSQRLKLAATLVHDPDLLLLDEPTSGLDPEGRAAMLVLLRALASRPGKSLILASHLLGDIERICESAIILNQGRLVRVGRLDELRARNPRCYRLQWEGNATSYVAQLNSLGVVVQTVDAAAKQARARVPQDWNTRQFFALARQHDLLLTGMEPDEDNLEAVYHRVIQLPTSSEVVESAAGVT